MSGKWQEVVRLTFLGDRFAGHALDLTALSELSHFQRMITETAKALWRFNNRDRERLPRGFEQRTRMCLRRICEGSAVAPLEVYIEHSAQKELFPSEPPNELVGALELAYSVFSSVARDVEFPEPFPRDLIPEYAKWGQSLAEDESIRLQPIGVSPICVQARHREYLCSLTDVPYEDFVDVEGEVIEVDVRQLRCQLWTKEGRAVTVMFDESQEETVTTALKDHRHARVRVRGHGRFSVDGGLVRCDIVDELAVYSSGKADIDTHIPRVEDELRQIASQVPEEEWKRLPADLTDNLDHYLYGTPRE